MSFKTIHTVDEFNNTPAYEEIRVPVGGYEVTAFSLGSGENVLLMLMGGPGYPSNPLQDSHAIFAEYGYRVVTWDQLGCGKSDKPDNPEFWHLPRFVEEVEAVRSHLSLGKVHLLGVSWGGVLGIEYCLAYPQHLKSFVMSNSTANMEMMERGFERLKAAFGSETLTMMARREAEGTTHHPEYQAIKTLLFYRHICRNEEWTNSLQYSVQHYEPRVKNSMFGPQPFKCNGNLKGWDRLADLHRIHTPVLVIQGEYDEIIPDCAYAAHQRFPNSELKIFKNCSHMPCYEDPVLYQTTVKTFLDKHS